MGLTKEQKAGLRQARILQRISEPGGSTSGRLAKELGTGRGMIINDIRDLRRKGYPIQVSSMVTEDGMYQAAFELMTNTPAANAERR